MKTTKAHHRPVQGSKAVVIFVEGDAALFGRIAGIAAPWKSRAVSPAEDIMPRKKASKPHYEATETFIFEIKGWKPSWSLSVNYDKYRETAFDEHASIELQGACIFPGNLAGRTAEFVMAARRDCLSPYAFRVKPDWMPNCVGMLELKPARSMFYTAVPHETLPFLLSSLAHEQFRYVVLYGLALKRGQSHCQSFRLEKVVDLEEY